MHPGLVQRVEYLAVDVELELLGCGVSDPYRRRLLVAGQPVELSLIESTLARQAVHDLDIRRVAGDGAQKPLAPHLGFFAVAGLEHCKQRERCVAKPAEAVVPVAHASQVFGQGCRRSSDDPARRGIRERLQDKQRLMDLVVVVAVMVHEPPASRFRCRAALQRRSGPAKLDATEPREDELIRSPAASVNSDTLFMSSPCTSTGVRKQSASGPAIAPGVVDSAHPGTILP